MKALLDACVLYPTLMREILLAVARTGAFEPLWSHRIVEEWRRAALRTHPEQAAALSGEIALLQDRWPRAQVSVADGAEEGLSLPDENDRHVLAAAIAGQADVIITLNLKDFPGRTLARYGLRAEHPDTFLLGCLRDAPETIATAVDSALARARRFAKGDSDRALLKRSRLPRLAKALVAHES